MSVTDSPLRQRCQEGSWVRDVLDHLEGGDDREAGTLRQQVLGDTGPVAEGQVLAGGMGAGRLDRLAGGVQAQNVKAVARQRLRRHSGAAAHVKQSQAVGRSWRMQ